MHLSLTDDRYLSLQEGDQPIPGFRLVRRRGRGGFGEVWEAEASGGFLVALKFVRLSSRARAAELRALDFVRGIHHPNLLANFGSWQVDDTLIIGMELADRSLWDRHVEATQQGYRGIPREELLGYLAEVAAGIDHLNGYRHSFDGRSSVGVQHRDLKPPNILLFGGGAKVADLGMARAMEGEVAGHTGIWTFAYAAPEFFRGETTRQSDQYGLAATFCQLRGGRLPFGGSAASVTAGHLFARPDLEALPPPERPIVERALAKVPSDRWPSCRAFVDALRVIPADSVDDILLDPDGPAVPGEESRSWFSGSSASLGLATSNDVPIDSSWQRDTFESFSFSSVEMALLGSSAILATPQPSAATPPPSNAADLVPTRILPAFVPEPPLRTEPGFGRRAARHFRLAALASATTAALIVAVVAIQASSRDLEAPATHSDHPPLASAVEPEPVIPELVTPGPITPGPVTRAEPLILPTPEVAPDPESAPTPLGEPIPEPLIPPQDTQIAQTSTTEESRPSLVLEGPAEMIAERRPDPAVLPPAPSALEIPTLRSPTGAIPLLALKTATPAPAPASDPGSPRNPSTAEAAFARGRIAFLQKSFDQAATDFDEVIRLNPGHATSYLLRAVARHRAGDPRAALADYAEVIQRRPDTITAYISRGQAYHELEDYQRAIADYDEAIRRRPTDGDAHFRRGLARYKLGDYAGSVADFDATLRLEPRNSYAAEFRTEALARLNTSTTRGSTMPAVPDRSSPALVPLRETTYRTAPTPAATAPTIGRQAGVAVPAARPNPNPTANPNPNPNSPDRRRQPLRRLLPWPFSKPR